MTAKTTIPYIEENMFPNDSLRFIYKEEDNDYCYLWAHYNDPDTLGNCASIYTKTINSTYQEDPMDINMDGDNYSAPFFKRVLDNGGNYNDEYVNGLAFSYPTYNGYGWWENTNSDEIDGTSGETLGFWNVDPEKQVIIKGSASKIKAEDSIKYFNSRPRESKIAAWASLQSTKLNDSNDLAERFKYYENKFENKEIPYPEFWGGYIIKPLSVEFWQGRSSRMHDRILYKKESKNWSICKLYP